jgi:predicted DNA-binding transcriptional regulator YafY
MAVKRPDRRLTSGGDKPSGDPPRRSDSERRLRQASHFARIFRVLELIQGRGQHSIKDIARELEYSERTVFRDLAVLEMAGVPYYHDREAQCLRIRPGFQFPAINLTDDELIGQATAATITSSPALDITHGAKPATRKLGVNSKEESARLLAEVERVTAVLDLKLADHSKHREMIRTVQWALIEGKQLAGSYASPYEPKPKRLTLHPYRLCLAQQAWYLIARPDQSDQPKTYRVPRFKSLRPLDAIAVVPEAFDLKGYFGNAWGVYRGSHSYPVQVRFSRDAADLVTETIWHATQTVARHKDGSATLSFVVDGLSEIVHWVLGWSGTATVLQPPELRRMVLEKLQAAVSLNSRLGDDA